jgi:hypothetical protein
MFFNPNENGHLVTGGLSHKSGGIRQKKASGRMNSYWKKII